ncbi:hypothetical protein B0H11DRAFT_1971507 [Mycena galericulata]|nr:hypothetical protein B0H11DRAFT_1971507 [Mycena galericulata]
MPRLDHPGATRMVRAVTSDPPGMRRMRLVRGRPGGCTDGMKDKGEAGGDAMARRGSHGLSQCQSGAAVRPGGQGDTSTEYRPAQWCAGGGLGNTDRIHACSEVSRWPFTSPIPSWAGEGIGWDVPDGRDIRSVPTVHTVVFGLLPTTRETGTWVMTGLRDGDAGGPLLSPGLGWEQ